MPNFTTIEAFKPLFYQIFYFLLYAAYTLLYHWTIQVVLSHVFQVLAVEEPFQHFILDLYPYLMFCCSFYHYFLLFCEFVLATPDLCASQWFFH